jgi:hypothetical protein
VPSSLQVTQMIHLHHRLQPLCPLHPSSCPLSLPRTPLASITRPHHDAAPAATTVAPPWPFKQHVSANFAQLFQRFYGLSIVSEALLQPILLHRTERIAFDANGKVQRNGRPGCQCQAHQPCHTLHARSMPAALHAYCEGFRILSSNHEAQ